MDNELTINKIRVLNAYNTACEEGSIETCKVLEKLFGADMFKPAMERIKTFEDACNELGEGHQYVRAYREWMRIAYADCKDVGAYLKLRIICAALNEGWRPQYGNALRYYPWFLYSTPNREFSAVGATCFDLMDGDLTLSVHLALRTDVLAEYCGNQFFDIWADFLFGNMNVIENEEVE